jgi:hypothetical protein
MLSTRYLIQIAGWARPSVSLSLIRVGWSITPFRPAHKNATSQQGAFLLPSLFESVPCISRGELRPPGLAASRVCIACCAALCPSTQRRVSLSSFPFTTTCGSSALFSWFHGINQPAAGTLVHNERVGVWGRIHQQHATSREMMRGVGLCVFQFPGAMHATLPTQPALNPAGPAPNLSDAHLEPIRCHSRRQ